MKSTERLKLDLALAVRSAACGSPTPPTIASCLSAVESAVVERGLDLDSPALEASAVAMVLDRALGILRSGRETNPSAPDDLTPDIDLPDPDSDPEDRSWPTTAHCGAQISGDNVAVDEHFRGCQECRTIMAQTLEDGPPGYSAGLAELGYDGDG